MEIASISRELPVWERSAASLGATARGCITFVLTAPQGQEVTFCAFGTKHSETNVATLSSAALLGKWKDLGGEAEGPGSTAKTKGRPGKRTGASSRLGASSQWVMMGSPGPAPLSRSSPGSLEGGSPGGALPGEAAEKPGTQVRRSLEALSRISCARGKAHPS